ncbi:substrate-binding domain-containing protein [Bryocella elongata]|uniref:substrate-binding domain-containing protein n=1 Tax=Bryocella elongata TaxID=863522 RepID=UPI001358F91D|nr:substrate-binding domain-containing protein [Bryocella elongata]
MIAVIPETTAQEVWETAHAQAARIAGSWGWATFWNGPSREDDLLRQIQIIDRQVANGVAGIILAPDHAVALISPVRAAVAKNIPVAIIDTPLAAPPKGDVLFVLNDNAATGRLAASRIAPHLDAKHEEVAVLGVYPNFLGSLAMDDALRTALQSQHPKVRLVEQRSIFGPPEADDAVRQLLEEHPSLAAIVALNVTQTRAAYSVLARSHLTDKVILIGCEQDFDVVYHVRTGEMDSVIAKDTGSMVRLAMQWIRSRREGTAATSTILVAPTLVTIDNVDSPDVQRVLAVTGGTP